MSGVSGAGLGQRRTLMDDLATLPSPLVASDSLEMAPENGIGSCSS